MIEAPEMQRPKWLNEEEFWSVMRGKTEDKVMVNFRLSAEGRRILKEEVDAMGEDGDATKALELLLREIRELRKGETKKARR